VTGNDHLQPALTPNTLNNMQLFGANWNHLNQMRKWDGEEKGRENTCNILKLQAVPQVGRY